MIQLKTKLDTIREGIAKAQDTVTRMERSVNRAERNIEIAEHNHAEAIVPLDMTERSRGWEIIGQVAAPFAGQDPVLNNSRKQNFVADTTTTDNKLDKLIGLLSDFMTMFAQKPTGISTRAVYDAYNTEKGRHYQLDANKRG